MLRFQKINSKKLFSSIISLMENIGYNEVENNTGGDEDFIMIDTLKKEWIWCENGFEPFCNEELMMKYQFSGEEITLYSFGNLRYEKQQKNIIQVSSWCEEEILSGQLTSKSYDGETMHFHCAAQCDDDEEF